jgi:hypothetical protein
MLQLLLYSNAKSKARLRRFERLGRAKVEATRFERLEFISIAKNRWNRLPERVSGEFPTHFLLLKSAIKSSMSLKVHQPERTVLNILFFSY